MLEAYKKHPQAYFLYVEDSFLLSDNADARLLSKKKVLKILHLYSIIPNCTDSTPQRAVMLS